MRIEIKPLSVNEAWKGRRFKTDAYKAFEKELLLKLKPMATKPGPLKLTYEFGFSNSLADIDNPVKVCTDVLQKKYGFNDRDVYELHVKKKLVQKGAEYLEFQIECV